MNFFERFDLLAKAEGTSANAIAKELGLSSGSITAWKNGTEPRTKALSQIASRFGVSADYLLCKTNDPTPPNVKKSAITEDDGFTEEEREHIRLYRAASPELQAAALAMLEAAEKARLSQDSSVKDK